MTRKDFIGKLWGLILFPYVLFLFLMVRKHTSVTKPKAIRIANDASEGISFHGDVICIRSGEELSIYSSKCTHLGCQIDKSENGMLVCPCHGSSFDQKGKVKKGPAANALKALNFSIDQQSNEIIIQL